VFYGGKGKGEDHLRTGHDGREGEYRYNSTLSLTSALDGVCGQRHAPAAYPRQRPGTHCIGSWVGPKAGLDGCRKSRLPQFYGGMILNQLWKVLQGEEFQNSSGYVSQTQAWLSSVWTGFLLLLLDQTAIFLKWVTVTSAWKTSGCG